MCDQLCNSIVVKYKSYSLFPRTFVRRWLHGSTCVSPSSPTQMYQPPIKSSVSNGASCYLDLHSKIWLKSSLHMYSVWICWLVGLEPSMNSPPLIDNYPTLWTLNSLVGHGRGTKIHLLQEIIMEHICTGSSAWRNIPGLLHLHPHPFEVHLKLYCTHFTEHSL